MPTNPAWYLFAVDATGPPAVERWLAELTEGTPATVVALVADSAEERPLATAARVEIRWLHNGAQSLSDEVRRLGRPAGRGYLWAAGEAGAMGPLRRYLRHELGLDAETCSVESYWRRGVAGQGHAELT